MANHDLEVALIASALDLSVAASQLVNALLVDRERRNSPRTKDRMDPITAQGRWGPASSRFTLALSVCSQTHSRWLENK